MGGVRNGDAEEDWCWDLNPGGAAMQSRTLRLWVLPLRHGLGSRRDLSGKERGERTLIGGPGNVPRGFGLRPGNPSDTADGAGN